MRGYALRHQQLVCVRAYVRWLFSHCTYPPDYFLIGLRGPLRVRALVLVRCPRSGRLRR